MEHCLERGIKVNMNGQGHITKMATMAINSSIKTSIKLMFQNQKAYDFETLSETSVNGALQSLYNHDRQMTLTYFMARSA